MASQQGLGFVDIGVQGLETGSAGVGFQTTASCKKMEGSQAECCRFVRVMLGLY